MPSNQSPLGARPARFRRERLLIVGCGDVGVRVARALGAGQGRPRLNVMALTSSPARVEVLRQLGITPLVGSLDQAQTVRRLSGLATRVIHLAPPPGQDTRMQAAQDPRTRTLVRTLARRLLPTSFVYGSTSGVYGDCQAELATESRAINASTERAKRRIDAETWVRFLGRSRGVRSAILRIPGIYAPNREGGTPRDRLLRGTPVLQSVDDVYTNHIHADDLARACLAALWRGRPQRIYNVNDDSSLKMGDYFDLAADLYGLPRPPRISRAKASEQLSPMLLSFMSESRRMDNTRLKQELKLALNYPTVLQGLTRR